MARLRFRNGGAVLAIEDAAPGGLEPEREAVADKGRLLEALLDQRLRVRVPGAARPGASPA
ncbi:MAG TPA: hypothetical protein VFT46_03655 [Holophagaceae bacterium]|nr:hypothetical protein [Holophagaceae bacterium]